MHLYELLYRLYFTFGAIMFILCVAFVITLIHKDRYKHAPLGCLFNLLIPNAFLSLRYFLIGVSFLTYGLEYSAYYGRGFGFLSSWCLAEALY